MTIETKYNIDDKVWFIYGNKAQCATIIGIRYTCDVSTYFEDEVVYELDFKRNGNITLYKECGLAPSKEELINIL